MRGFAIAAAAAFVVSASPVFGQAAAPAAQAPTAPAAPAQAAPAQTPAPPAPFPQGAKIGFVNLQAIAQLSVEGKAAAAKVSALAQKKQSEAAERAKLLQANQQKLETGGSLLSESARAALQKDIDRQTLEGQRFEQDAQAELQDMQADLQQDFQARLMPILEAIAKEKSLQVLFSASDSGVIWAEPGIDLTLEAVKRLDAAPKTGAAK